MAKTINIKTVAEGVETPSQLEFLKMIDCDMIQGYIFSKPRPIKEFEQLLINQEMCIRDRHYADLSLIGHNHSPCP